MTKDEFLGGVVEGFYGQPWSHAQRLDLFSNMVEWGLNTYFYSPKDDLKHRALWRTPYTQPELTRMSELVDACQEKNASLPVWIEPWLGHSFLG